LRANYPNFVTVARRVGHSEIQMAQSDPENSPFDAKILEISIINAE